MSIDLNGRIVVWETHTGRDLYSLECNQNDTSPVALSSNSQLMAVASTHAGEPCYIRNVSNSAIMASITPPAANICIIPVAFTPNSRLLAYIHSGASELYLQSLTSKQAKVSSCIIGKGLSAAFLGKDRLVLVGPDKSKQFWNLATQSCERTLQDEEVMLCSNRSAYVTFCRSAARPMSLYDAQTHEKIRDFHDSINRYWKAHFDQTGKKIVTTSKDSYIRIWDVQSGTCLQQVSLARNLPRDQPGYACFTHDDNVFIMHMKKGFLVINTDKQVVISSSGNTRRRMLGISPDHTMIAMEEITSAGTIEGKVSIRLFDLLTSKKYCKKK